MPPQEPVSPEQPAKERALGLLVPLLAQGLEWMRPAIFPLPSEQRELLEPKRLVQEQRERERERERELDLAQEPEQQRIAKAGAPRLEASPRPGLELEQLQQVPQVLVLALALAPQPPPLAVPAHFPRSTRLVSEQPSQP